MTFLRPIFSSQLLLSTKLGIFKTYIGSMLTYADQVWYAYLSATDKSSLQRQQNVAIRKIVVASASYATTFSTGISVSRPSKITYSPSSETYSPAQSPQQTLRSVTFTARSLDTRPYPRDFIATSGAPS